MASARRKGPVLSDDDLALWRHATRADRRLEPESKQPSAAEPPAAPARRSVRRPTPPIAPPAPVEPAFEQGRGAIPGLDKRNAQRLRRGQWPIAARVDLHHHTQVEAHAVLNRFIAASHDAGHRCVLVITGKGVGRDGHIGVLRGMVPRWLNQPPLRNHVVASCPAQPRHGGDGALYVLLKRRR